MPDIYKAHINYFFINNEDPYYIKKLKMEILVNLTDVHNTNQIYNEFYVSQSSIFFFFFFLLNIIIL